MDNDRIVTLLEEMREVQKRHLEEYQRVANEALALQKQSFEIQQTSVAQQKMSVEAQLNHLRFYRRVVVVTAVALAMLVAVIIMHV
jgi:hypothetical protein